MRSIGGCDRCTMMLVHSSGLIDETDGRSPWMCPLPQGGPLLILLLNVLCNVLLNILLNVILLLTSQPDAIEGGLLSRAASVLVDSWLGWPGLIPQPAHFCGSPKKALWGCWENKIPMHRDANELKKRAHGIYVHSPYIYIFRIYIYIYIHKQTVFICMNYTFTEYIT